MASNRPINLGAWGISWEEYKELSYFCQQYDQKKRAAADLLTLRVSTPPPDVYYVRRDTVQPDGRVIERMIERGTYLPHSGQTGDPTAAAAAKRERLLRDVRMIEQAARAATEGTGATTCAALLRAVTTRAGVQAVYANPDTRPPMGERQFYDLRRKFFWILSELKNGDLEPI